MIRLDGLTRSFGDERVLDGVDLDVEAGTVCALLGPNGAGKTTTVSILATLLQPDAGRAWVAGHDVVDDPAAVKRSISLTGQHAAVDGLLTGEENLVLLGRLSHLGRARARTRAAELLERFDLTDAARRRVSTYSGGMRRRLDLAAGLVAARPVLFLDEPTTGLDPRARLALWDVVDALVADGTTVLLTTQYLDEADRLADHVAVLSAGRVVAEGSPAELKRLVPGEQVELGFADDASLDAAVVALAEPAAVVDRTARRLQLGSDGSPDAVMAVLERLRAAGVTASSLALHAPSLDDVFFRLTGSEPVPTHAPDTDPTSDHRGADAA